MVFWEESTVEARSQPTVTQRKSSQGGGNKAAGEKQRADIRARVHRVFHESF